MSGGTYTPRTREYLAGVPNACLAKPFGSEELLVAVHRLAGG